MKQHKAMVRMGYIVKVYRRQCARDRPELSYGLWLIVRKGVPLRT